jgi:hypothetical protein
MFQEPSCRNFVAKQFDQYSECISLFFAIVRTCTYPVYLEANHDFAAGASFHVRKPALPDFCEVEQTLDCSECNRKVGWDVCI